MNYDITELLILIGELTFANKKYLLEIEALKRQLNEMKNNQNNN